MKSFCKRRRSCHGNAATKAVAAGLARSAVMCTWSLLVHVHGFPTRVGLAGRRVGRAVGFRWWFLWQCRCRCHDLLLGFGGYGFAEMPAVRLLSAVSHALLSFISPGYTRPDSFGTYLDDT